MSLDAYFGIGVETALGSQVFDAESIRRFARKYDPQPFHVDEEAARASVFGGLCASGWHTAATWMRFNLATPLDEARWAGPGPVPLFGPSPGFKNLKWPKPVFAGETVTFTRTSLGHQRNAGRPGWRILTLRADAFDSGRDKVLEFESAVLVQAE